MELNEVTGVVISSALKVHTALGPGLLENAYRACLAFELTKRGMDVEREIPVPVNYGDLQLDIGYRMDLLVEEQVIVEVKAVARQLPIHESQILSHIKLRGIKAGLLINFHVESLRDGIKRFIN